MYCKKFSKFDFEQTILLNRVRYDNYPNFSI